MKVIAQHCSERLVEKFLVFPKTLCYRTRWLKCARIVQVRTRTLDVCVWVDTYFEEENVNCSVIDEWFSLSRASWLVLPRVLMEQMPTEWQMRFTALLEEFDEEFDWVPEEVKLYVQCKTHSGKYAALPRSLTEYRHPDLNAIEAMRRKR